MKVVQRGVRLLRAGSVEPFAPLAANCPRRRTSRTTNKTTIKTIYGVTSLALQQVTPQRIAELMRGHWQFEALHHMTDVAFAEDASCVRTGAAPRAMATTRTLAIGLTARPTGRTAPP
ncbi:hypothetical protein [Streptomyces sp. NPDC058695]|uniref:hypothetical protein n=1 Tax=Streptomyces sp. NPDC058695 TaxID=3346604 RepID=UPI00365315C8